LGGKLRTSEGRELFAALSANQPPRDKAALLADAAKKVGIASCPWADEILSDLGLPKPPGACEPLPAGVSGVEISLEERAVSVGGRGMILSMPSKENLAKGFGERHKPKGEPESLEIVPIRTAVEDSHKFATRVAKAKGDDPSNLPALLFVHQRLHPLPKVASQQLVHSIELAGIKQVRQVFLSDQGKLCTAPFAPGG
jgi:hypothetical protein